MSSYDFIELCCKKNWQDSRQTQPEKCHIPYEAINQSEIRDIGKVAVPHRKQMSKQDAQRWCYKWSPNGKKPNASRPFPVTGNWFRPAAWQPNCQRFGPARLQLPVRCSFGCIKASTAAPPLHCYAMCNRLSQWVSDLPACLCRCLCRCLCLCPTEPVSDRDWCPLSVNGHNWWLKT